MKISLNWLRDFIDIPIAKKRYDRRIVVGKIEKIRPHPNADTLKIPTVDIGTKKVEVVCGGVNMKEGQYVVFAPEGVTLPNGLALQRINIRGVESAGMVLAKDELGLEKNSGKEIYVLQGKKYVLGQPFAEIFGEKQKTPDDIAELLTHHSAEVEETADMALPFQNVVTGKLLSFEKIQGSDKLHVGQFDIGNGKKLQIVFGSVYVVKPGWILPVALPGAKLHVGEVKETEFRSVKSQGMVCGDDELGIQNCRYGLTVFPKDTPIGIPVADALCFNDFSFHIENKAITHRPDLWSHYGFARELSAILKKPLKPYAAKAPIPKKGEKLPIRIEDKNGCRRYCGLIMKNVVIEESPQWIRARLQAAGMRPVNNIVDATNYVMLELGQPMHAFDRRFVKTGIIVRRSEIDEVFKTLDGQERRLPEDTVLVCDYERGIDIGGIMGGENSEIKGDTAEIILEAANFDAVRIRHSANALGLRTDAAQRFEKGLDPLMPPIAIHRCAELILKLCPNAEIAGPMADVFVGKPKKIAVKLSHERIENVFGAKVPRNSALRILGALAFKVKNPDAKEWNIEVPSFRAQGDIALDEDVIEEVVRIYGYDHLEPILPKLHISLPPENRERALKHAVRDIFSLALGFTETYNHSFYDKIDAERCRLRDEDHLKLVNPLSADQTHLVISLIPNLLKNIVANSPIWNEMRLYEIGRTHKPQNSALPFEEKWVAGVLYDKNAHEQFMEANGAAQTFLKKFQAKTWKLAEGASPPYAHPKKCAAIVIDGKEIGYIFELHPIVQSAFNIEGAIACFEINFTALVALGQAEKTYKPIPKFPALMLDVSVAVPKRTPIQKIQETIDGAHKFVSETECFDLFEDKTLGADKKSVAFRIKLLSKDRTLNEKDLHAAQENIHKALRAIGGKVRGVDIK